MNKPPNWYQMDNDKRKEWEYTQRALENAEYETQQVRQSRSDLQDTLNNVILQRDTLKTALKNALRELEWMDKNTLIKSRAGGDYIDVDETIISAAIVAIANAKGE
jgi:uncharacterized protein